jgi:hypothetical protein
LVGVDEVVANFDFTHVREVYENAESEVRIEDAVLDSVVHDVGLTRSE